MDVTLKKILHTPTNTNGHRNLQTQEANWRIEQEYTSTLLFKQKYLYKYIYIQYQMGYYGIEGKTQNGKISYAISYGNNLQNVQIAAIKPVK